MVLTTWEAATARVTAVALLSLLQNREVINDDRFLAWGFRNGGGEISCSLSDSERDDEIDKYLTARGVKPGEFRERVKSLVRRRRERFRRIVAFSLTAPVTHVGKGTSAARQRVALRRAQEQRGARGRAATQPRSGYVRCVSADSDFLCVSQRF